MNHSQGRNTKVGVARTRERNLVPGNNDVELMGIELIAVTRVIGAGLVLGNISGRFLYWPGELRGGSRRKTKQRLFGVRRNYSAQKTSNHRS